MPYNFIGIFHNMDVLGFILNFFSQTSPEKNKNLLVFIICTVDTRGPSCCLCEHMFYFVIK